MDWLTMTIDYGSGPRQRVRDAGQYRNFEACYWTPDEHIEYWFSSDLHFSHKNIIKYTNRPFENVEQMNTSLINNHNNVVKQGDGVVFLGDIAFTNDYHANTMLDAMNGDKYLVIGNHDLHHKKLKKYNVFAEHLMLILERNDYTILFTHFPIENLPEKDFNQNTLFNCHGHTHNENSCSPRHINISVEQTNYTPINLKEIEKMVHSRQLEIIG